MYLLGLIIIEFDFFIEFWCCLWYCIFIIMFLDRGVMDCDDVYICISNGVECCFWEVENLFFRVVVGVMIYDFNCNGVVVCVFIVYVSDFE